MAENPSASREHRKHDENDVEYGGNTATKSYWEAGLPVGSHG